MDAHKSEKIHLIKPSNLIQPYHSGKVQKVKKKKEKKVNQTEFMLILFIDSSVCSVQQNTSVPERNKLFPLFNQNKFKCFPFPQG